MQLEDEFGDVIAKARAGRGLFAAQTARTAGLEEPQLVEIEHYRFKPAEGTLKQLADTLHLDPEKLVESAYGMWTPRRIDPSSESIIVHRISVPFGQYGSNAYIAACTKTRSAAVIDPGGAVDEIRRTLDEHQLSLEMILVTHAHADHIGALRDLVAGIPEVVIACSPDDRDVVMNGIDAMWRSAADGETFTLGDVTVKAIATPGHTPGSTCYLIDGSCFVGDTLFAGSIGRPSSTSAYEKMLRSIRSKVLSLPGNTILLPGHGPATTAAEELEHNPFF